MTEVIARKKRVAWMYIVSLIIGVALIICASVLGSDNKIAVVFMVIVGIVCIAVSVVIIIKISKTPLIVITREEDTLIYPDGKCKISELENVYCRRAHARGISYEWGEIIISVNGREYKYNYVADVERVQQRIAQLMQESKSDNPNYSIGAIYG